MKGPIDNTRFINYLLKMEWARGRGLNIYPGLRAIPWHDPSSFPITAALEHSIDSIKEEIRNVDIKKYHPEAEKIYRQGRWDILPLYQRGIKNVENCAACPTASQIIDSHDTIKTLAGLTYISRLGPHTRISAHSGPTNVRVRCHLGLSIPVDGCGLRIADTDYSWTQDKCIVFDDSFIHEVWNNSDSERLVLIVDLWHPDLSEWEIHLLKQLHTYASMQGDALSRYWRMNDAALNEIGLPRDYD